MSIQDVLDAVGTSRGRVLPLLRFEGRAARGGHRPHGDDGHGRARTAARRPQPHGPREVQRHVPGHRQLEDPAPRAPAGRARDVAVRRQCDRPREVPTRRRRRDDADPHRDHPPGRHRGTFTVTSPEHSARVIVALLLGANEQASTLFLGNHAGEIPFEVVEAHSTPIPRRWSGSSALPAGRSAGGPTIVSSTNGSADIDVRTKERRHDRHHRTEKLTKSYGQHRGIVDVDLEVKEGEAFGFLGPNGAGKTTTIRTLLDLIRPTSGRRGSSASRRPRIRSRSIAGSATCRASSRSTTS